MKKKIFTNMCIVALLAIIVVAVVATHTYYQDFEERIFQDEANLAEVIQNSVEENGLSFLNGMNNKSEYRITYISSDGSVLFDSEIPSEKWNDLENHSSREEIKEANQNGVGQSVRNSDTLSEKTYYYALRLKDNTVLRISLSESSELAGLLGIVPELLVAGIIILVIIFFIAGFQTKKIIQPINEINFVAEQDDFVYDELYPFLDKISSQRKVIDEQIKNIQSSEIEFKTITENMSEGLILLDKDENIIFLNRSVVDILQLPEVNVHEYSEKKSLVTIVRNEDLIKLSEDALEGKHAEGTLYLNDKVYHMIANAVIVDEKINGAVILILDDTEKEQREQLRREFSANVSHELKTPLTSISGYAEIMESGLVKDEDMLKFSGIIHTEALRLIHLVEDIIKISRLDESNVELEKSNVDFMNLVEENIAHLQKEAEKNHIHFYIEGNGGTVFGVEQILDEMVRNILENAVKYNKENGQVYIQVNSNEQTLEFQVRDTGIGIPKDSLEHIFERFYRVDKSHSKTIGGTGLGLSIVKHGAIYHNAKVSVDSELGKGTVIKLVFDLNN